MLNSKHFETVGNEASGSGPRPPTGALWGPMVEFFDEELDLKYNPMPPSETHPSSIQYVCATAKRFIFFLCLLSPDFLGFWFPLFTTWINSEKVPRNVHEK
jgi:hypothetical protein